VAATTVALVVSEAPVAKELFAKSRRMLKQERGVALLMAVFTVTMLSVFAMELMYESSVEYAVTAHSIADVKAYYAAKSGAEISLLRVLIYRKAMAMLGSQIPNPSMLDPIWKVPFAWPPVLPEGTSAVDKDEVKKAVKESDMKSQYFATIESEGSKIDINDLGSSSKPLADAARQQIQQIINSKIEEDEEFAKRYRGYDVAKLLNNIADWVDDDKESKNGGDESAAYQDRSPSSEFLPPNQPFKTIQELHQVAEMTDDIYDLLAPRITVFGSKGINVNYATKDVLMSLTPQITAERAKQIMEARDSNPNRGPFKDENDFVQYLNTIGVTGNPFREGNEVKVPLVFDAEHNFRIVSNGMSGKVTKTIVAITYDTDSVKERLKTFMAAGSPTPTPTPGSQPNPQTNPQQAAAPTPTPTPTKGPAKVPSGRPEIVYWNER
jgi:general secretion pathway protein K